MTSKNGRLYAGLDIGSRTTKAVVIDSEGRVRGTRIEDSKYSSGRIGALVFERLLADLGLSREEALAVQIKSVDGMDPQLVGALGAALLASERSEGEPQREPALRDSYSI